MSGRSRLFVPVESLPGKYDAVSLRAYLGGDEIVKEGEYGGKYGFFIDTTTPGATKQKVAALKPTRERQQQDPGRRQISRTYSQDQTDTYPLSSSHAQSRAVAFNSQPSYAYDSPRSAMPATYGASPRTNSSLYEAGMDSLSRQSSRNDAYEAYPGSDRPSAGSMYASSTGTQPIPIPAQRRPSTFSDASEDSFNSMYGFKGFPASPRGDHPSSNNIYGRR